VLGKDAYLLLLSGVGRPALQPHWRARSVHVSRPTRSTDSELGRPARLTGRCQNRLFI